MCVCVCFGKLKLVFLQMLYVCMYIYIHTQIALTVTHNNANDRSTAIYTNNKYKLTNELQAKNNYKQFKHIFKQTCGF
jgi:hypothetical protein